MWDSIGPDGDGYGVMGRAFRADGSALGAEFRVSAYAPADQIFSALAMDEDGDAVAAWLSEGQDGSGVGAFARRYRLDEIAPVVVASLFRFQTSPHQLRFTFTENVSASLASADLTVVNVAGGPPIPTTLSHYDATTQTATFSFGQTLTDGQYRATLAATDITDAAGNPLAADHVFEFFFLTGDANHDGRVNLQDFNILAANFGQSNRDFTHGDFNFDQIVSLTDFNLLAGRFGQVLARDGSIVTAGQRLPRWPGGSSPRGSSDGFPGGTGSDTNAEDEWPIMG